MSSSTWVRVTDVPRLPVERVMYHINNCPQPLLSFGAKNVTIYGTEYKIGAMVFL